MSSTNAHLKPHEAKGKDKESPHKNEEGLKQWLREKGPRAITLKPANADPASARKVSTVTCHASHHTAEHSGTQSALSNSMLVVSHRCPRKEAWG